jgi:hypothetical protein
MITFVSIYHSSIQGDSGGKANILGGDYVSHFEKKKKFVKSCVQFWILIVTSIRRQRTKFSRLGDLASGICAPMQYTEASGST